MTRSLRDRRRAERFAQLLDEATGGRRQHLRSPVDEELTELVTLRHRLVAAAPPSEPDPEFRAGLRASLLATAEREGIRASAAPSAFPTAAPAPPRTVRAARAVRARTAVIAGVTVGAVAFAGMSAASEGAVPGDALYGVKRSTERAQLAFASSDVGRGHLYLGFARTRLAEAQALAGALGDVLDDMDRDTSEGVRLLTTAAADQNDPAALDAIDEFAADQREALDELARQASGADLARIADSVALLDSIEDRAADLRRSIEACAGEAVASLDALGPRPEDCVALPAPRALPPPAPDPAEPDAGAPRTAAPDEDGTRAQEPTDEPIESVTRGGTIQPPGEEEEQQPPPPPDED